MFWFIIALIGPFLYALTNHIDKILLEKYFKGAGVGVLVLFSSLLSAMALPFIFLGDPTVMEVSTINRLTLCIVGILNIGVIWFYLLALQDEEASITIVFYQIVPVLAAVLGYFVLDEVLNHLQIAAMTIIILGTTIIAFEIDDENNFKLRKKTIIYMTVASTLWAIESVIFKYVALEENVWRTLFWEHVMLALVGVIIYISVSSYRKNFNKALKINSKAILSLNVANESIYITGNIVVAFAYMLAPISLILLAESFQPIFVFVIGIILTIFFPKVSSEDIKLKNITQKILAILITGVGTYLLYIS